MSDASDRMSQTKVQVSNDKAYEMEFLFAREEIRIRMDYNRRLLAGQVTLVAALVAGGLALAGRDAAVGAVMLQATSAIIIWLNSAFIFENAANNSHISVAAVFMHRVLNSKYKTCSSGKIYEWEAFLSLERQYAKSVIKRNFFLLDASFIMNFLLTGVGCVCYYVSLRQPGFAVSRLALAGFVTGLVAVVAAYWAHFNSNATWKLLVSADELAHLQKAYHSIKRPI